MAQYLSKLQANLDKLGKWAIKRISRTENTQVDALAGIDATLLIKESVLLAIYLQVVSSIAVAPVCSTNNTSINWMNEIEAYIRTGKPPEDCKQAHKIQVLAARFTLIEDNLYGRSFEGPHLRYLNDAEA